jgi:hypothetical protein
MLVGCDPAGPGAEGTISLEGAVEPSQFTTLNVKVYPDSASSFSAAAVPDDLERQQSHALDEITFPYRYNVGEALGTTPHPRWRVTAWLSGNGNAVRPTDGEPFCSVAFRLDECSAQFGDYCGTSAVDCIIANPAR